MQDIVLNAYRDKYAIDPSFVSRGPGRVNLIGEHTDYNDGFVFPMAIERASWIAFTPREDSIVEITSLLHKQTISIDLENLEKENGWGEYIKGVAFALKQRGYALKGFNGIVTGNVPLGSGLSSSAAFELALAHVFAVSSNLSIDGKEMALIGQEAENNWVGVSCGIMDQLVSSLGEEGKAILLDCRSLECKSAPLPDNVRVVILDTMTRRELHNSAYNERRSECEEGAKTLGYKALRDVPESEISTLEEKLSGNVLKRARHVITECYRTLKAAEVLNQGDAKAFGELMDESHESLRDDFEVSSEALNTIVEIARSQTGCLGARMTGAGFGGCAVALVEAKNVDTFIEGVKSYYKSKTDLDADIFSSTPAAGAGIIWTKG